MAKSIKTTNSNHAVAEFFAFLMYVFPGVYLFCIALVVLAIKFDWF